MRRPRTANALRGPPSSLCDIIRYGYFKQVRFLVNVGADLQCREPLTRRTPLMLCALMEPPEWGSSIAMTLLEAGVKAGSVDFRGHNVLHLACIWCRERLVRVLLRAIDFDLGRQDKDGNTALHLAAMSGNVSVTQLVAQTFRRYCVNLNKANNRGMTACQEALCAGYTSCARAINNALAGKRVGSATKDVRFAAPTLESPRVCSNDNIDLSCRSIEGGKRFGRNGVAKNNQHSLTVPSDTTLPNKAYDNGSNVTPSTDKEILTLLPRPHTASCCEGVDDIGAATESSNDSIFLENIHPIQEVVRPASSTRSNKTMRSPRPMTAAFLTRQDSYSTLTSSEEKRSTISYPGRSKSRARKRKSQNPLYFYGYKKDTDVIQCAPESDFRNTAEFVCKIAHLPPNMTHCCPLVDTIDNNGPWMNSTVNPLGQMDLAGSKDGWRIELKSIFKVYEHQWSPSWRTGRKLEFRPPTPDLSAQEEWEKGRRGRRQSVTSKVPNLQRRASVAIRPKRSSSTTSGHGKASDSGLDTGRDSGGETMTSPTPGRRRSGLQLDATFGQGSRTDNTSQKGRTEHSIDDSTSHLPTLSERTDETTYSPSYEHVNFSPVDTNGNNSGRTNQSIRDNSTLPEVPSSQPKLEDVRNLRSKSTKVNVISVAETKSSGPENLRAKRNNSSKAQVDVPRVNEILISDPVSDTPNEHLGCSIDASKLLVPNPYSDDEDEEGDDHDINI